MAGKIKAVLMAVGMIWFLNMGPQLVFGTECIETGTETAELSTTEAAETEAETEAEVAATEIAATETTETVAAETEAEVAAIETAATETTEITATEIAATELDLGDYQSEMTVGTTQLLTVTVIPLTATDQTVTYTSTDVSVAKINGLGRITALSVGETKITVVCGSVEGSFTLTVVEEEEEETESVAVTDIEIGDYEEELEVGDTVSLSVTVLPQNATDSTVTYWSGDSSIATVNSSGEVKGISKGKTIIYCSAGYVSKEIPITVKVATEKLSVNNNYLVMKPGGTFALQAAVTPAEAAQEISYQARDTSVATVSADGAVCAKACGSTSILVSNGDATISVSVIVNETGMADGMADEMEVTEDQETTVYEKIISAGQVPVVQAAMLKYFYDEKTMLIVEGDGYSLYVDGNSIVNYKNRLYTGLVFEEEPAGYSFTFNRGKELCGPVTVKLEKKMGNYLYLYNPSKEKYELIQTDNMQELCLTSAGEYLLTEEKLSSGKLDKRIMGFGGAGVVFLMGTYIIRKRKYWFW